jgi:hypothetical protein
MEEPTVYWEWYVLARKCAAHVLALRVVLPVDL